MRLLTRVYGNYNLHWCLAGTGVWDILVCSKEYSKGTVKLGTVKLVTVLAFSHCLTFSPDFQQIYVNRMI